MQKTSLDDGIFIAEGKTIRVCISNAVIEFFLFCNFSDKF